jgi:hypothetical protein
MAGGGGPENGGKVAWVGPWGIGGAGEANKGGGIDPRCPAEAALLALSTSGALDGLDGPWAEAILDGEGVREFKRGAGSEICWFVCQVGGIGILCIGGKGGGW